MCGGGILICVLCLLLCCVLPCVPWILLGGSAYEYQDGAYIGISFKNDTDDVSHKLFEKTLILRPRSVIALKIQDIPEYVSFVLAQTHSYKYNISFSYERKLKPFLHVNGTNIGLIKTNTHNMEFFIQNDNKVSVMILVAFQLYLGQDPIPGGCNMEFFVENAPYLSLTYSDAVVVMEMQPAAFMQQDPHCDAYPSPVHLEVYHMYLEERDFTSTAYFDAIKKMMTVEGMEHLGWKVPEPAEGSAMRRIHSAYPGTGSVYGVVARSPSGSSSAYVPAITYACGNGISYYDDCEVFTTPLSEVLCACMLFVGLFICAFGHRKFLVGSSLISFLWGTVVACIILELNYGPGYGVDMLGVLVGFLFGVVWYFLWPLFGVPIVSALLSMLALGFLMSSAIMYAGLGSASWLSYSFSFWSLFVCIMITVPVLFMSAMHVGNMVACATLGAYVFIAPIDHYVGSNLKYIFINSLRRAVNADFHLALVDPPFEVADLLLVLAWLSLSAAGTAAQLWLCRRRPPFPPPGAGWCRRGARGPPALGPPASTGTTRPRRSLLQRAALAGGGSERTPLLVPVRVPAEGSPDSVFESPPPVPAPAAAAEASAPGPEKLASTLLAVLEPGGK